MLGEVVTVQALGEHSQKVLARLRDAVEEAALTQRGTGVFEIAVLEGQEAVIVASNLLAYMGTADLVRGKHFEFVQPFDGGFEF